MIYPSNCFAHPLSAAATPAVANCAMLLGAVIVLYGRRFPRLMTAMKRGRIGRILPTAGTMGLLVALLVIEFNRMSQEGNVAECLGVAAQPTAIAFLEHSYEAFRDWLVAVVVVIVIYGMRASTTARPTGAPESGN